MRTVPYLLAALTFGFAGCGGSETTVNHGTGTGTLLVTASVVSSPNNVSNPKTVDQFVTEITVRVQKAGIDVTNAIVKVKWAGVEHTVPDEPGNAGSYATTVNGGIGDALVTLNVDSGADNLHNLARKGPGIQYFTNLGAGDVISRAALPVAGLHVAWFRPAVADSATLRLSQFNSPVDDSGAQDVPTSQLQNGRAVPCRLDRRNTALAAPTAATGNSELNVTVQQSLPIDIVN